jgi:hypothetical protein
MSRTAKRPAAQYADDLPWQDEEARSSRDSYWDRAFAIAEREAIYGAAARSTRQGAASEAGAVRG